MKASKHLSQLIVAGFSIFSVMQVAAHAEKSISQQDHNYPPLYIEASLGYVASDWDTTLDFIFPDAIDRDVSNQSGGFAWGGVIGYQVKKYLALEVGGYGLPSVDYDIHSKDDINDTGEISHWFVYMAPKVNVPIPGIPGLDIFGKFGLAYRVGDFSDHQYVDGVENNEVVSSPYNLLEAIMGAGLQYDFNQNWSASAQYLFLPDGVSSTTDLGPNGIDHIRVPEIQIITGVIGYHF